MTRYSKTMSEALEEVREASARADAKRAMSKDKDMKQNPFSKDDDASDDDVKAASKNIIMQLRKSVSMRGNHSVEFANGKQKVDAKIAQAVQDKFNKIKRPADKQKFQDKVAKSYKDLLMALKEQYEMVEEEVELDTIVEGLSMMVKDPNTKKKMQLADGQKVQWNGTNYETDGVTKKQVLVMKDGRKEVVMTKKQVEDSLKNGSFEVTDFGRVSQPEEVELGEGMKMNDPKLLKMFDKLKKGDKIKLKTSSTISKGKDFVEYIVKSKNTVNKGRVEKITLATVGNEGAVKKFLYKRDGTVGFAIGDMGASIDDIKEEVDFNEGRMKELHGYIEKGMSAQEIAKKMKLDVKTIKSLMDETELDEAKSATGYEIFHKDFSSAMQHATAFAKSKGQPIKKDEIDNKVATGPKKPSKGKENSYTLETEKGKRWSVQVYNMGNKFELNMYLTSSHVPEGDMLDEAPKMKYALVGKDMKIYSMGSDERDLRLDRKSLEQRFKDAAPLKMARLKTAQSIGDKVDKSQLKEEEGPDNRPDSAKEVDQGRDDKKKTRIAQLQLQIAKATETINKLNAQEK